MPEQATTAKPHHQPSPPASQRQQPTVTAMVEFTNAASEHQFQQSYAASYRFWDAAAALIVVTVLIPYVNFLALEARLCASIAPTTCPDNLSPAWHLHQLLRSFPCATGPAGRLAQATWWLRHWGPATLALYQIDCDVEAFVSNLGPIAALLWLFCTRGAASVTGEGYSKQRTLVMTIWRVSKAVSGTLALAAYKLQLLPGWHSHTERYWGHSTMFGATRMIWHAHLMAVSVPCGLLLAMENSPRLDLDCPDCAACCTRALRAGAAL
jgi:hypothetical protein